MLFQKYPNRMGLYRQFLTFLSSHLALLTERDDIGHASASLSALRAVGAFPA